MSTHATNADPVTQCTLRILTQEGAISSTCHSSTVDSKEPVPRWKLRKQCTPRHFKEFTPQASEIFPRLFLSDMYTATDPLIIEELGITHVLSVVDDPWYRYSPTIKHMALVVDDHPTANIESHLDACVAWIKEALNGHEDAKVMVHCMWGMSRSASIVIAYAMATKGTALGESLDYVRRKRLIVSPNPGFIVQLRRYGEKLTQRALSERSDDTGSLTTS